MHSDEFASSRVLACNVDDTTYGRKIDVAKITVGRDSLFAVALGELNVVFKNVPVNTADLKFDLGTIAIKIRYSRHVDAWNRNDIGIRGPPRVTGATDEFCERERENKRRLGSRIDLVFALATGSQDP